jgi:hypothetical protein
LAHNRRAQGERLGIPYEPVGAVAADVKASASELAKTKRAADSAVRERGVLLKKLGISEGRAQILSRQVGGSAAENLAERGKRFAGGGHGVTQAREALAAADAKVAAAAEKHAGAVSGHEAVKANRVGLQGAERDAYNRQYAQTVKKAADAKGLPEPTYFKHIELPLANRSSETAGNVSRAMAKSKQSKMALFKTGRAIVTHQAYRQGLLDTIKAKHQIGAVADVAKEHAFEWSLGPKGLGMTPHEVLREMLARKLRPDDVTLLNPGILHKAADVTDLAETAHPNDAAAALDAAMIDGKTAAAQVESDTLARTPGWIAVPKAAGQEILANTRPSGKLLRVGGRLQGLQQAAILGTSVSWEPMQMAANFLQSFIGMHGNVPDMLRNNVDYHRLGPVEKRLVDEALGISASEGMTSQPQLGYHQGPVAAAFERVGQIPLVKYKGRGIKLTDVNPIHMVFGVDRLNNDFFRRSVFINAIQRQAARDLVTNVGRAQASLQRVSGMLNGDRLGQLANVLHDPRAVDEAARYTDRVLGDYLNFTARERKAKTFVMFYGFMRYATKTLFYTLPVHHPLAGAIALKLGQLHNEEIYKIFGTRDLPPWVYSRSYEYDSNGKVALDKNGNPKYRDLARINPVTSLATDVVTQGPQAFAGIVSPLFQGAANLIANENVSTSQPLRLHGSAEKPKSVGVGDVARVMGNSLVASTLPGRLLINAGGKTQGDDSLPFSQRPIVYKSAAGRARDAQRILGRATLDQQLFPLFNPRTDTTKQFLAAHGHGPVAQLDKQIKAAKDAKKTLLAAGHASENGGYETKQYADLQAHITNLEKQRRVLLGTGTRKAVHLKQRPETPQQRVDARTQKRLDRLQNLDQGIQDRINKRLERLQVESGG